MAKVNLNSHIWDQKYECIPLDRLRDLQNERLSATLHHVFEHSPFYQNQFEAIGLHPKDVRSIHDLPFTTKSDLRSLYPFGLFSLPLHKIIHLHASSGTTGKPTIVGYSREDLKNWFRCVARGLAAAGIKAGVIVQNAYPYGLSTGGIGFQGGAELMGALVIPISSVDILRELSFLTDLHSGAILCTPSFAASLLSVAKEEGINPHQLSVSVGVFGGEPWSERMRQVLENGWGLKAYDTYGLSEVVGPGVAYECAEHCGLHINEDFFLPEIVDFETGDPVPDGKYGELVFTTLMKEAMPLIRYRTRDRTRFLRGPCPCGRTSIRIERISRRLDDHISIGGKQITPHDLEVILLSFEAVEPHYQLVIEKDPYLPLQVRVSVLDNLLSDGSRVATIEKEISAAIHDKLEIEARVKLVSVKTLVVGSGKAKRIIRKKH